MVTDPVACEEAEENVVDEEATELPSPLAPP